ncbi:subtilisin family serine protease [Nocardia sp. GAS34]
MVSPLLQPDNDRVAADAARLVLTDDQDRHAVLIELRIENGADPETVRAEFLSMFQALFSGAAPGDQPPPPVPVARHYVQCVLRSEEIDRLVELDSTPETGEGAARGRLIYRVWPDFIVHAHLDRSVTTVKADAAARTFGCSGSGIVWAVVDSGIDRRHPHFQCGTLADPAGASLHRDFTAMLPTQSGSCGDPLTDAYGHGTHVAGIIAGRAPTDPALVRIAVNEPTAQSLPNWTSRTLDPDTTLSGVAPKTRLVSLKVLDDNGDTLSSAVIAAIDHVRAVNAGGRDLRIHGVNLSLGCAWPPTEYAAGQSPLCRELDLLVGTGVVVVVSAGNAGASGTVTGSSSDIYGVLSTISDPGNAASAITVGSAHRYKPHTFGITFDSSKGPTLDGRLKPDLIAPGERITSAATGKMSAGVGPLAATTTDLPGIATYIEDSGTSMAAAHVSGAIAAFLSTRTEYIGQPQRVKQLFLDTATDLGRHPFFQGAGLIDLLRALSTV